ncbi:MAG: sulfatase-like hydrolase/transferase [Armatimonadota bacterium]
MPKRPHIIIFNPDQWRADVMGHFGNPAARTPVLDRLVETDAVSFRNAFCQNPVCTPSRCSFMSGWYPHTAGHRTMHHMMRLHEPVLLRTLKEEGYFVWWGGKNDLVPGQHGYDAFCDVRYRTTRDTYPDRHSFHEWRGDPAGDSYYSFYQGRIEHEPGQVSGDMANVLGAVEMIRNAPAGQPLCLFLALGYPHPPYAVEEPFYSAIDRAKLPPRVPTVTDWTGKPSLLQGIQEGQRLQGWTEERWTELRAVYYGMCMQVDYQLGLVVDALREAGMYDDSALFLFSDHGDFTGDYGLVEKTQNTFEDCLTNVPFVIKPPKGVPVRPGVRDALVELIDFPATVEALTGIPPRHTHFGRSLLPVLAGETDAHRDAVFCEGGRLMRETHTREAESLARMERPAESLYYPRIKWQVGDGPEHGKGVMCRTREYKYVRRRFESDELYDLRSDPRERHNRIDDPALAPVLAELKDRMLTFFLETGDAVPFDADSRR